MKVSGINGPAFKSFQLGNDFTLEKRDQARADIPTTQINIPINGVPKDLFEIRGFANKDNKTVQYSEIGEYRRPIGGNTKWEIVVKGDNIDKTLKKGYETVIQTVLDKLGVSYTKTDD